MPAFVTIQEFGTFLGRTFTPGAPDTAQATQALEWASGLVQEYTGQHLFYVADDVVQLWPRSPLAVVLPEMPVVNVTAVVDADGVPVTGWSLRPGGVLRLTASVKAPLTVTYSHGYQVIPGAIKEATARSATRLITNPTEVRQQAAGSFSVTYGPLTDTDRQSLSRYRMPMVV